MKVGGKKIDQFLEEQHTGKHCKFAKTFLTPSLFGKTISEEEYFHKKKMCQNRLYLQCWKFEEFVCDEITDWNKIWFLIIFISLLELSKYKVKTLKIWIKSWFGPFET